MARLTSEQIREILIAHHKGTSKSAIASEYNVDVSTIRYHIENFERSYGTSGAVYALIRPIQRQCDHPSLKCLICGQAQDNIKRKELEQIELLKTKLDIAREVLGRYGYELE